MDLMSGAAGALLTLISFLAICRIKTGPAEARLCRREAKIYLFGSLQTSCRAIIIFGFVQPDPLR